jgi:predicted DNA binding CopG/RHH family protein
MNNLDQEERDILDSFEAGEWQTVPEWEKERSRYEASASGTLEALKVVGIEVSAEDIQVIKERAAENGIPYQEFISNLIHKFAIGKLVDR